MSKALTITVAVEKGKCQWTPAHLQLIRAFTEKRDGKTVVVSFDRPKKVRSQPQNNYYWGVVLTMIAHDTGNSVDDLHDAYKELYITPKFVKIGKVEVPVPRTTTDLTPDEFNLYITRVSAHAAQELGIVIPEPS